MDSLQIRAARPTETGDLTELVLASKRHWGYPEAMIDLWRADLAITAGTLQRCRVLVAELGSERVGVAALCTSSVPMELEHLWIHPRAMGEGIGRRLFREVVAIALAAGAETLRIISDPNAVGFYEHLGALVVGEVPSRPAPRMLPELRYDIEP